MEPVRLRNIQWLLLCKCKWKVLYWEGSARPGEVIVEEREGGSKVEWFEANNEEFAFIFEYLYMKEMGYNSTTIKGKTVNRMQSPGKTFYDELTLEQQKTFLSCSRKSAVKVV
jgi:hypothetical protein